MRNDELQDLNFIDDGDGMILTEDGIYEGTISGYRVKFERNGQGYEFETKNNGHKGVAQVKIVINGCQARVYYAK